MNPPASNRRRSIIVGLIIIVLIAAGYALRSHFQHSHGHEHAHDHEASVLSLNDGQSASFLERDGEQIIGREGETVAFLFNFFFHINLRVAGFAPRQFNRSTAFRFR